MSFRRFAFVILLCVAFFSMLSAQMTRQSGAIIGTVTDNEGNALPGVTVTAISPALIGSVSDVTSGSGSFRLINLPPGTYEITAVLSGFKSVKRDGILVQVGQTYTVNLITEASALSEEITITGSAPVVDVQSSKVGIVVSSELLQKLPLNRSIGGLFNTVAGSAASIGAYSGSVHGANSGSTAYEIDGVNGEDPTTGGMQISPQYDSMEEIEITTGGLSAQVGASGGSFIQVVTKSGGNAFHGQAQVYYTDKSLSQNLFTNEELTSMGRAKPALPVYDLDLSGSLGGPIIKDKLWFYGTMARMGNKYLTPFEPTTINGVFYPQYDRLTTTYAPFLKLTTQLSRNMRFFVMFNGTFTKGIYGYGSRNTLDRTFDSDSKKMAATGELSWTLGSNTFVNFRGAYNNSDWALTAKPESRNNVGYIDGYTGYQWNSINDNESYMIRRTVQGSARLTHYMDDLLGGKHEFGAGVEYIYMFDRYAFARGNPLAIQLYDGDIYYHRGNGDTDPALGNGVITLANMGTQEGDTVKDLPGNRMSAYIQDSFTLKNRLTINVGARYDKYWGGFGGGTTTGSQGLSFKVGEEMAKVIGFNPYAPGTFDPFRKTMDFGVISPRAGISYDLFGNGKTAIKVSYGRFYEAMPVMWFSAAQPNIQAIYEYNWFDLNGNMVTDDPGIDRYEPSGGYGQFTRTEEAYLRDQVASKGDPYALKAPYNNEFILSLSHELAKNVAVKLQYINKRGYGDHADVYYDRSTEKYWFSLQDAPAGTWVPFTTTVPGVGEWPTKEVTVYYRSNNAPESFWRSISNPYSKRQYNGVELTFDKRYANGWALGGSVTYSTLKSINPGEPNAFVNGYGYDKNDVPLAIKLYGTFTLPGDFIASFFYRHLEGGTLSYGRNFWDNVMDVTIIAPDNWAAANNVSPYFNEATVMLEPAGTHRGPSYDNIDFRAEKTLRLKFGTVSIFADIFNLLGNRTVNVGQNVGGVWRPDAPGVSSGTRTYDYNYKRITSVTGMRTFKLSARITF
ncbi:MAG: TonB-dependent receptor [Candidatus Aminicenantales bacterium]